MTYDPRLDFGPPRAEDAKEAPKVSAKPDPKPDTIKEASGKPE